MNLRLYFMETRPPFLLLSPVTFSVGLALAAYDGWFSPLDALLGVIGVVLAHMSVNVLNDYFDYRSGIDLETRRTPFSGGSGMLVSGEITQEETFRLGLVCLAATNLIGVYFVATRGTAIIPVIAIAAFTIYLYSTVISKLMLGEFFAGLNFGPLVSVGAYFT
jgi:1,4-dihydroxy-2-naphthoate octaprenyltransferase